MTLEGVENALARTNIRATQEAKGKTSMREQLDHI